MLRLEPGPDGLVTVTGEWDAAQCSAAQAVLDGMVGDVTLDLAGLEYISSAGLGVLLKTHRRLAGIGGGVRLRGVAQHIRDILHYSALDMILQVEPARD